MTKEERAEQEQAQRFLAAPAPGGSQVLSLARFRRHTLRSMGGELLDQVLADAGVEASQILEVIDIDVGVIH